jgi:hypothetical protein
MHAVLIEQSWLRRVLEVHTAEELFLIEYNGRGLGYESVLVNGVKVAAKSSLWFVPLFEFLLRDRLAVIEVRVWPWLTVRSFHLIVSGEELYGEGVRVPQVPQRLPDSPLDSEMEREARRRTANDAIKPGGDSPITRIEGRTSPRLRPDRPDGESETTAP